MCNTVLICAPLPWDVLPINIAWPVSCFRCLFKSHLLESHILSIIFKIIAHFSLWSPSLISFLNYSICQFSSVQSLSCVRLFVTPWTAARQATLSITNSLSLPKLICIESVIPSTHLILCRPFSSCPQSFPASRTFQMSQLFTSSSQSIGISASTSVLPMNIQDWSPLEWLDLLAAQGTLKSLLQHHSSKASILQCSAFFTVQISHPYMTTVKTIALSRRTFACKVMSLLLNMLYRLVITFLPRNKCLLIWWLQSPSAMILEPPKNKVRHCFHCFPIYLP